MQTVKIEGSLTKCMFSADNISSLECVVLFWFRRASGGSCANLSFLFGSNRGCNVVLHGKRGTSWPSDVSAKEKIIVLFDMRTTFARLFRGTLSTLETSIVMLQGRPISRVWNVHFAWQAQTLHSILCTSHFTLFTWHCTHSTLHTPLYALLVHLTLHFTLHTSNFTLYTSHFTLYTQQHFTLNITQHSTLAATSCNIFEVFLYVFRHPYHQHTCEHSGSWAASCIFENIYDLNNPLTILHLNPPPLDKQRDKRQDGESIKEKSIKKQHCESQHAFVFNEHGCQATAVLWPLLCSKGGLLIPINTM